MAPCTSQERVPNLACQLKECTAGFRQLMARREPSRPMRTCSNLLVSHWRGQILTHGLLFCRGAVRDGHNLTQGYRLALVEGR